MAIGGSPIHLTLRLPLRIRRGRVGREDSAKRERSCQKPQKVSERKPRWRGKNDGASEISIQFTGRIIHHSSLVTHYSLLTPGDIPHVYPNRRDRHRWQFSYPGQRQTSRQLSVGCCS